LYFGKTPERGDAAWAAGLILLMKDELLLSELDMKDTDAISRSKEEVFISLQVQGSYCRRLTL